MTKGHETCLMTHLPQPRTKRGATYKIPSIHVEYTGKGKGKMKLKGTRNCNPKGQGWVRLVQLGNFSSACCAVVYDYN